MGLATRWAQREQVKLDRRGCPVCCVTERLIAAHVQIRLDDVGDERLAGAVEIIVLVVASLAMISWYMAGSGEDLRGSAVRPRRWRAA